jgi:uncharacterized membrane protein YbhN (UPF0104 family)
VLSQRSRIGIWSAAILTALTGLVNLWSAVTSSLPDRVHWLEQFLPLEIRVGAHLFTTLSGFFLLILAVNLLHRKRIAWWLTIALLIISIASHLIKGLDYEEGLLSLVLLIQLLVLRPVFTAQSDRPSILQGLQVLGSALLFTLAYGTLGFWLLDRHYAVPFSLPKALGQTFAMFFTDNGGGIQPRTHFGQYFADSIYLVSAVTLLYAVWMLFQPIIFRGAASEAERQQAKVIIETYGRSPLAQCARILPVLLSLTLFSLSIWAITNELHRHKPEEIFTDIAEIPHRIILLAILLTVVNYVFLTGYDTLAIRFIKHPLPYKKTALAAVISYAISNSVGLALLSGSAIRYRLYTAWRLPPGKIAQIITFCNLSFWIGLFAVGGLIFVIEPLSVPGILHLPFETVRPLGFIFLGIIVAYLTLSSISRRSIKIKGWVLPHLPLNLSLAQIVVTSCDWTLAAGVLYIMLPAYSGLSFLVFLGSYLLAQIAGIVSNVPGGLGVFETVLILLLSPPVASDRLLVALLVYRIIYYLFPLCVGVGLLAWYELKQRHHSRKTLEA